MEIGAEELGAGLEREGERIILRLREENNTICPRF